MCHMLQAMLERQGYNVTTAVDGSEGLELIKETIYDFVLCDVRMPKMDGMAFLKQGKEFLSDSTLIMMSAFGSVDIALEAMKAGAYDFISKPFKSDEVILTLKKAEERELLRKENRKLKEKIASIQSEMKFGSMIAQSNAMVKIVEVTQNVARYDTTVLDYWRVWDGKRADCSGTARKFRSQQPATCCNKLWQYSGKPYRE